jgi:hypothetical protein
MIQPGNLVVEEEEEYNITILFNFSQVEYKALIIKIFILIYVILAKLAKLLYHFLMIYKIN